MQKSILRRFWISGWAAIMGLCSGLIASPGLATTVDHGLAKRIYEAIEHTQTTDPDSYITTFDYQGANGETVRQLEKGSALMGGQDQASAESCSGLPLQGQVYGSALLDGEVLEYEIDFHDQLLRADYKGEEHLIPAKDMVGFQGRRPLFVGSQAGPTAAGASPSVMKQPSAARVVSRSTTAGFAVRAMAWSALNACRPSPTPRGCVQALAGASVGGFDHAHLLADNGITTAPIEAQSQADMRSGFGRGAQRLTQRGGF
jgi:hypothetical protein